MNPIRFLRLIAATALGLAGSAHLASAFEGQLDMQITNVQRKDQAMVMHYTVKGQKLRIDMPMQGRGHSQGTGSMATVIDHDAHQMVMLIDSGDGHKMSMRHQLQDPKAQADQNKGGSSNGSGLKDVHPPVATGRTDVILGYPVAEYKMVEKDGNVIDLWLAKGLGTFMNPGSGGMFGRRGGSISGIPAEWQNFAETAGFFPLRMTVQDKSNKVTMKMEVIKLDKGSVPDNVFSAEGYPEMSLGNLLGR